MYLGRYPELLIDDVSKHIQQDDMKNIFQKNDFIGLNHYQHIRIKADNKSLLKARGAFNDELPFGLEGKDAKLTLMGWEIVPDAYYDQIMDLKNNYGNPDIYLTENGAAYPDLIENGEITSPLKDVSVSGLTLQILKDVDGLTPASLGELVRGENMIASCTPKGCMRLLEEVGCDLNGKNAIVVGRSILVGFPMAILLTHAKATVTLAHSRTEKLKDKIKKSDIVVAATGIPNCLLYTSDAADE